LVVNSGIEPDNVVEVDITTGLLVRELVTGVDGVTNVAATATMFAVSNFGATLSSLSQVKIYDVNGTLLASFGGTRLSDGETDYVGERLGCPMGLVFTADGQNIIVTEAWAGRVTMWTVGGAFVRVLNSGLHYLMDVKECLSPVTGRSAVMLLGGATELTLVIDPDSTTNTHNPIGTWCCGLALVPGLGVVHASSDPDGLLVLSTVRVFGGPGNATVAVGSEGVFSVSTAGAAVSELSFTWTLDGVVVGTSSPQYSYMGVPSDMGQVHVVQCRVEHAMGSAVSGAGYLVVVAASASSTLTPSASQSITASSSLTPSPTASFRAVAPASLAIYVGVGAGAGGLLFFLAVALLALYMRGKRRSQQASAAARRNPKTVSLLERVVGASEMASCALVSGWTFIVKCYALSLVSSTPCRS
jgi:hypothetical protein